MKCSRSIEAGPLMGSVGLRSADPLAGSALFLRRAYQKTPAGPGVRRRCASK